jgi:hypothetical protein
MGNAWRFHHRLVGRERRSLDIDVLKVDKLHQIWILGKNSKTRLICKNI